MTDKERQLHELADDGPRAYAPFTMKELQDELEKERERNLDEE
tara:strand:+ start:1913 stop:2041 length:129 start_codon:yes stop_codon:yes gene_type:complete